MAHRQAAYAATLADEWARTGWPMRWSRRDRGRPRSRSASQPSSGSRSRSGSTSARRRSPHSGSASPPALPRSWSPPVEPPPPSCTPLRSRRTWPGWRSSSAPPTARRSCRASAHPRRSTSPTCSARPSAGATTRGSRRPTRAGGGARRHRGVSSKRHVARAVRARSISTSRFGGPAGRRRPPRGWGRAGRPSGDPWAPRARASRPALRGDVRRAGREPRGPARSRADRRRVAGSWSARSGP